MHVTSFHVKRDIAATVVIAIAILGNAGSHKSREVPEMDNIHNTSNLLAS